MSRGLGRVQRFVLEELKKQHIGMTNLDGVDYWEEGWISVLELARLWHRHNGHQDDDYTRAELESVRRAVIKLADAELISIIHFPRVWKRVREGKFYSFLTGQYLLQARRFLTEEQQKVEDKQYEESRKKLAALRAMFGNS